MQSNPTLSFFFFLNMGLIGVLDGLPLGIRMVVDFTFTKLFGVVLKCIFANSINSIYSNILICWQAHFSIPLRGGHVAFFLTSDRYGFKENALAGVSHPRPTGHMQPRMAMTPAQYKTINLLKTLFSVAHQFSLVFMYLMCGPRQLFFFQRGPEMPHWRI